METIINILSQERIFLRYDDLSPIGDVQGLYTIHPEVGSMILLDSSLPLREREHRCVFAHELGHHFHPPRSGVVAFHRTGQFSDSQREIIIGQDESKALRWATSLLMPSEKVWDALKSGYNTIPLLAEQFYVTEWFVRAKIGHIRLKERSRGKKLKWRDIINKRTTQQGSFSGL